MSVLKDGRQRCKFGAAVFNSTFALAMQIISEELVEAGVALSLRQGPPNFWDRSSPADAPGAVEVHAVDDAFVDDEAFYVCAATPAKLDRLIDKLLVIVPRAYDIFGVTMSFKPK